MVIETVSGGVLFLIGRVLCGTILGYMGFTNFLDLDSKVEHTREAGMPAPRLSVVVSSLLLVLGGLSIVVGAYPVVGGAMVALFFLGVTPIMKPFWTVDDPDERWEDLEGFLRNAIYFGAALVFVDLGGTEWPYALNIGF